MDEKETGVMKRWIIIPLAIAAGDGAVKKCAEAKLSDGRKKELFGGHICLQLLHNPGVALSALRKNQKLVLVLNSILLGVSLGEYANILRKKDQTAAKTGLALLIGGGVSNLIDRFQRGYVTDYFSIHAGKRFQRLEKIVFNCSDFCVFLGALLYVFGKSDRQ